MPGMDKPTPAPRQTPQSFLFTEGIKILHVSTDCLTAEGLTCGDGLGEGRAGQGSHTSASAGDLLAIYANQETDSNPGEVADQVMDPHVDPIGVPPNNVRPVRPNRNRRASVGMRFGQKLQGQASHDALVAIQDAEIRLLENIKKCLMLRVKADREYANGLGELVATANRLDTANFKLSVFQAWSTIVKETEAQQRLIQDSTNYLCSRTLDRLCHLITDKKEARKFYLEERQRLQVEFHKLQEEPLKLQGDYDKLKEKFNLEKTKYDEVHSKGKPGGKYDDAKARLCKAGSKLHKTHNDYLISLHDVTNHQRHYLATTLPGLLNYHQQVQEAMVNQSKSILEEYVNRTNTSNEKFIACHGKMQQVVTDIDKDMEYNEYTDTHKSDPLEAKKFEFDKNLLNDYRGRLLANEISLDDLTIPTLKESRVTMAERLANCRRKKETKESELKTIEESLTQRPPDTELADETRRKLDSFRSSRKPTSLSKKKNSFSFEFQEQAMYVLKKEIAELNCMIEKNQSLYKLVNDPFDQLGDENPPSGVDLFSTPPEPSDSGSSPSSQTGKTFFQRIIPFKKTTRPTPLLPDVDTIERADSDRASVVVPPARNSVVNPEPVSDGYQQEVEDEELADELKQHVHEAATHPQSECEQYTVHEGTLEPDQLEDMELFHGVLPRDEVQRLLVNDGDFLVRESRNRKTGQTQYVLSVMWNGHKHFIIQGHQGGWRFEGQQYSTIPELVTQQYKSNQPVTNKSQAILRTPIVREDWELKNDDVQQAEKIDNGHFGEVFRGYYKVTNQEVAIKICRETLSEDAKKKFLLEGRILKQYDHPNIVRFIGIAAQRQPVMIVMEFVPGGSLLKFMQSKGSQQTSKQMMKMCEDAAAGMAYLEEKGCIHRDLAARNCLVGKNQVVKISDFGMSREEEVYRVSDGLKQIPIKWTAPEALNLGEYTSMCDVWSYGVLMWEVFSCGDQPYNGQTNNQAREKIETGYRMPAPDGTPDMVYALMLRCWDGKPTNRPHFSEVHSELGRLRTTL